MKFKFTKMTLSMPSVRHVSATRAEAADVGQVEHALSERVSKHALPERVFTHALTPQPSA